MSGGDSCAVVYYERPRGPLDRETGCGRMRSLSRRSAVWGFGDACAVWLPAASFQPPIRARTSNICLPKQPSQFDVSTNMSRTWPLVVIRFVVVDIHDTSV